MAPISLTSDEISGGTLFTVSIANLPSIFSTKKRLDAPLRCMFESETVTYNTSSVVTSPETVECITPAGEAGIYNFFLADIMGIPLTDPQKFLIYDCAGMACSSCKSAEYPKCDYCNGTCSQIDTCGGISSGCPDIFATNPEAIPTSGGSIEVTVINMNTENVMCDFNGELSTPESKTTDSVTCKIPSTFPGVYPLSIYQNGERVTSYVSVELYDCSHSTNCSDCVHSLYPECGFCSGSCRLGCEIIQGCPIIDTVYPSPAQIGVDTCRIEFSTEFPSNDKSSYHCLFIAVDGGTEYQTPGYKATGENAIVCDTPSNSIEGEYDLQITYQLPTGTSYSVYTPFSQRVTLYACEISDTCGDTCFTEYCGFCGGVGCTGISQCPNSTTSILFDSCPTVAYQSKEAYSIGLTDGLEIDIMLNGIPPNAKGLNCQFEDQQRKLYTYPGNFSTGILTCSLPMINVSNVLSLSVRMDSTTLVTQYDSISVVDCSVAEICDGSLTRTLCTDIQFCGWCISEHRCSLEDTCNALDSIYLPDSCPSFSSLSVDVYTLGTDLFVNGSGFYPFPSICYDWKCQSKYKLYQFNKITDC
eukprot:TRINITY_DN4892_c0_g1_i1.p1 TRINITY_DN4892_c0_g1~~TRINITY_DN4892_c0_g1_i1.p1  ORF type:complete len:586 (-),score=99.67 TRINITY_DN4892_c0_g1_i1:926-2683(-)